MRFRLPLVFGALLAVLILAGLIYNSRMTQTPPPLTLTQPSPPLENSNHPDPSPTTTVSSTPLPTEGSTVPSSAPLDLTADANGLSKSTVAIQTSAGLIKFKFYPNDAPKTVRRMAELVGKGFFNGLTFHRVVKGFVVQGGDPLGNGTGGSGQKLEAEFNSRKHVEGAVAMARGTDVNSADSQFYISLGTHTQLDGSYTVFGQVIEGMDTAKKLKAGDKMLSVTLE